MHSQSWQESYPLPCYRVRLKGRKSVFGHIVVLPHLILADYRGGGAVVAALTGYDIMLCSSEPERCPFYRLRRDNV